MSEEQVEYQVEEQEVELSDPVTVEQESQLFELSALLPEAPALAWTQFVDGAGFTWNVTLRAGLPVAVAMDALRSLRAQMELFERGARGYKWQPVGRNGQISAVQTTTAPASSPAPPPAPAAPAAPVSDNGGTVKGGVSPLNAIKVDADGRVEFYVQGFKWPFKDRRGPETVAGLFNDSAGDWRPEHFAPGAKYEQLALQVRWAKPGKYYDVLEVTA